MCNICPAKYQKIQKYYLFRRKHTHLTIPMNCEIQMTTITVNNIIRHKLLELFNDELSGT